MKILKSWLQEFIAWEQPDDEIAHALTMLGFEVEEILEFSPGFEKVIVVRIDQIDPHPNADKLTLCTVNDGTRSYNIVCGAKNMHVLDRVPLAQEGAMLAGGFRIKASKIRGAASEGMLCSEKELGLANESSGIMILPSDVPLGKDLSEVLGLRDSLFVINVTPNRGDALSIYGIARELGVFLGKELCLPKVDQVKSQASIDQQIKLDVQAPDLCQRYMGKVLSEVKIGPSPMWLRTRLERSGIRSINNVVDVTNYVLLELGHPMHAFDLDTIKGSSIIVRKALQNEQLKTLDELDRSLNEDMLVIADQKGPIALAGVMGGLETQVTPRSTRILLECASFCPKSIRRTSRTLSLMSESSYRFERGVDPNGLIMALDRAAYLIQEIAGGMILEGVLDSHSAGIDARVIPFQIGHCRNLLGIELEQNKVREIFHKLSIDILEDDQDIWHCRVPTYRYDLEREVDLIEEIARVYDYQQIPTVSPVMKIPFDIELRTQHDFQQQLKLCLSGMGLNEVITYSFISEQMHKGAYLQEEQMIRILNPVTQDHAIMRTSLLPGLMNVLLTNQNQQCLDLGVFELGKCYFKAQQEVDTLGIALMGSQNAKTWNHHPQNADFFTLKGVLEIVLKKFYKKPVQFRMEHHPFFYAGQSCSIFSNEKIIGILGEVHPAILKEHDFRRNVVFSQIEIKDWDVYACELGLSHDIPRFPAVTRDLAIVVDSKITHEQIVCVIDDMKIAHLEGVTLFDIYMGEQVPVGKRSLAYSIKFRNRENTLTMEEVDHQFDKIREVLQKSFDCQFR
ncbi:MAG: phenylalanine--tRNA ligase subunit beta [Chlamydiota bacterium]|nr:phenylalanine--tRNA ligase subunit beta [Chlamydiota bacterium]